MTFRAAFLLGFSAGAFAVALVVTLFALYILATLRP